MSKTIEECGGSAFPRTGFIEPKGSWKPPEDGMTLRDYFAAKAMQSIMQAEFDGLLGDGALPHNLCKDAYEWADAMLKAREVK